MDASAKQKSGKLRGVRTKLERAIKHRADLQVAVDEFSKSDFYEIKTELDYKGRLVGRAVNVKTPGEEVGVLIGECAYSLRSMLDQLAYQFALHHTSPMPKSWAKSSAFPIFQSGPLYRGEKKGRGRGAGPKLRGMSPSVKRIIECLQPYHRRRQPLLFALWQLEELSNLDKHRFLPLTGCIPAQGSVELKFHAPNVRAVALPRHFPGPIEERRRLVGIQAENVRKPEDLRAAPCHQTDGCVRPESGAGLGGWMARPGCDRRNIRCSGVARTSLAWARDARRIRGSRWPQP